MPCLGSASSIATPTRWPPRREFSIMAHLRSDFFEYDTSGRWMQVSYMLFYGLSRLAAEAVNRSPDDIVRLEKLAEGGFNHTFLITMRCGFGMVARIPYPATIPKYFAIASEIAFPTGGSLENAAGSASWPTRPGITLDDKRFWVGPDTSLRLCAEVALLTGAEKELAYLRQFGRPLLPFQRVRREAYKHQEQPPSDHIENLDRYLLVASSLIPRNPAFGHFHIRLPDLQPSNIIVSRSPDSNLHVVGLIDWQHTSIPPLFLLAGIPQQLQIYDDIASLPEKLDDMDETQQSGEMELYRRRLVHYHYVKNTEEYNELHYATLTDSMGVLRCRLFCHASDPWEGETLALKVALIQATKNWRKLTGGGPPCPVVFDPDDVRETMKLDAEQKEADESLEACRDVIGFGPEGWVPAEHYEEAMGLTKKLKEDVLAAAESEEERAQIAAHWPLDDMDEEEYDSLAIYVIEPVYQLRNQNIEVY
ncbi:hypothetical protein BDR05DRAFT_992242 [Suillus weaverae]|nr:hypothetical protein BDR05DRAFT_992242 [Suillus weaverae]